MEHCEILNSKKYIDCLKETAALPLPYEKLRGKTILVVGATGLIGAYLIDSVMFLNESIDLNCRIFAVGRDEKKLKSFFACYSESKKINFISQDVMLPFCAELEDCNADYIFHLASNTHPVAYATVPIETIMTNIGGTDRLLDFASRHGLERFIYASSVEIYGENRGDIEEFSENYLGYLDCNTLRAGYPEGKRAGEALCQAYRAEKKVDVVIPRLSRTYGPTMLMSDSKAISQFIKKALAKENIVLKSTGNQLYSYCFVADAVNALLYCLLLGKNGEAYNISDKNSNVTLKELAEFLAGYVDTNVVYEIPNDTEKKGYSTATKAVLDSSKLQNLGWCANYDISQGLKNTLSILGAD